LTAGGVVLRDGLGRRFTYARMRVVENEAGANIIKVTIRSHAGF
jgi:hypothetical protein